MDVSSEILKKKKKKKEKGSAKVCGVVSNLVKPNGMEDRVRAEDDQTSLCKTSLSCCNASPR